MSTGELRSGAESSVKAIDATFGVPGLPQSATGQVALLCGVKAPVIVGRHINAYPTTELKRIIASGSIMERLVRSGRKATFLNGYRDLDRYGMPAGSRLSVTTLVTMGAGIPFRDRAMVLEGKALTHDITGEHIAARGQDVSVVTVEHAVKAALSVSMEHDFTLFECFVTDIAGHGKHILGAQSILRTLDRFVAGLLNEADSRSLSVVLASDHGNIEDLSVPTHTRNPVPFAIWGGDREKREEVMSQVTDIGDVALALEKWIWWC